MALLEPLNDDSQSVFHSKLFWTGKNVLVNRKTEKKMNINITAGIKFMTVQKLT